MRFTLCAGLLVLITVSPATLVLRAAGQYLVARRSTPEADAPEGGTSGARTTLVSRDEARLGGRRSAQHV